MQERQVYYEATSDGFDDANTWRVVASWTPRLGPSPPPYRPLDCASQPVIDLQALFTQHVLLRPQGSKGSFVSLIEHFFFRDVFRIHAAAEIDPPFHDAFDRPTGSTPSAQAPPFDTAPSDTMNESFAGAIDLVTEGSNIGVVHLLYLAATAIVGILSDEPLSLMDISYRRLRRLLRACPAIAKPIHPSPYQCTHTTAVNTPNETTASFRCLGHVRTLAVGALLVTPVPAIVSRVENHPEIWMMSHGNR